MIRPRCAPATFRGAISSLVLVSALITTLALSSAANNAARPALALSRSISSPPVFVDAQGTCPLRGSAHVASVCRITKIGNAVAGLFDWPYRPWGVAYAFNCGPKPGDFYLVVGLPNLDGMMPETGFDRRGRTGRGHYMETGRGDQTLHNLPAVYRSPLNLEIASTCTWHVRAVLGASHLVAGYVPPVPPHASRRGLAARSR